MRNRGRIATVFLLALIVSAPALSDSYRGVSVEGLEITREGVKLPALWAVVIGINDYCDAAMPDRIAEKLKKESKTAFFFAVGAAHMPGDSGIAALLQAKRYTVTRTEE